MTAANRRQAGEAAARAQQVPERPGVQQAVQQQAVQQRTVQQRTAAQPVPVPRGRRAGWRNLALAATAGLTLVLSGCATTIETEVTSFHQLPARAELQGRSFAIVADPAHQGSLEDATYADAVRQALLRQGLVEAPEGRVADYAVNIRYSSVPAQTWHRHSGSSVGVGLSGGGFSLGGLGIGIGIGIPIGRGSDQTTTTYRHELDVDLSNWGASSGGRYQSASGTRVFEGKAVAESDKDSIASVMPALVEGLFNDFPGANGKTRVVDVRLTQ